ncbi:MAG TPA: hypothetical protein PLN21_12475 [Gemmatales bacterium]|nr:hypothetical protein [Gemmatales bacterium]
MPDKPTKTSAEGKSAIRRRETAVPHYESHRAKNEGKKYSIGSMTRHEGYAASKPEEKHSHVHHVETKLAHAIHHAEQVVHRHVKHFHLTQAQLDALVSYVYSVGEHHARSALSFG